MPVSGIFLIEVSERWHKNVRMEFDWKPAESFPPGRLATSFGEFVAWCEFSSPPNPLCTKQYSVDLGAARAVFHHPNRTTRLIYERGPWCVACGRQGRYYCLVQNFSKLSVWVVSEDGVPMTKDHNVPKSKGGGGGENLNVMCYDCNNAKGDQDPELFLGLVESF